MRTRRLWLFALTMLAAATLLPRAAAGGEPVLWSAAQRGGHVVVTYSLGDLAPGDLVLATNAKRNRVGELVRHVRLRERLPRSTNDGRRIRFRSRHTLLPGVYFVQVSGIEADGVLDCTPSLVGCGQNWSNVRKIVIPAAH